MAKWQVFDNEQPADTTGSLVAMPKGKGWDNSIFPHLREAVDYALKYMGNYAHDLEKLTQISQAEALLLGYVYSGAGDIIKIVRVQ